VTSAASRPASVGHTPPVVWTPSAAQTAQAEMTQLLEPAGARDYNELWRWSVDNLERFWGLLFERFGIMADGDSSEVLRTHQMPGAQWFPNVRLSYAEHVFRARDDEDVAIKFSSETGATQVWTWSQLAEETARVRSGLLELGVGRGDRVAASLPNVPETVAAFLAVASLGAVWSCCSPEFGARTVIDRFAQIEPKALLFVDRYTYGGREFDRVAQIAELQSSLPTLGHSVRLVLDGDGRGWDGAFPPSSDPLAFERVPFDHPLWIVYSSGTTGLPKAIVHGHGGPLLEQLKTWRLHHDVRPGDTAMWLTTTGWAMWNYLVGALLSSTSIVLYDGDPGHPDLSILWDLVDEAEITMFGVGAAYLHRCMKAEADPLAGRRFPRLRSIGVTGSPLAPEAYDWVAERFGDDVWLVSSSGGTDVAAGFVGGSPLMPVHAGELPARMLGVAVEAWNEDGVAVVDEVGELVVTKPMPSMPVFFWNDPGFDRYKESYFSAFPGVWRHGDWIRLTSRGSAVVYGRSDSTINRGGIRIGTAEIYNVVESHPAVTAALAVDVPSEDGTSEPTMRLFVVLADGWRLDQAIAAALRQRLKEDCSPRHLPDEIVAAPDLPRTLTGKLLEVPVKKLLMGRDPGQAATRDAMANPEAWDWFVDYSRGETGPKS
jgi:acetoacetyl-CoA synthetase